MESQLVLFFQKKPNHRELGGLFFKDMGASSFKIQLITQQLREYAWRLLMPGAGNVSRFSIFSGPASHKAPWLGGGSPSSSLLQGHQAKSVFTHSLSLCIYVWTFGSAVLIFLDGDTNNRGNAHLFIEARRAGGGPLAISVQCGPQGCCHTTQCTNQWRREVTESPPVLHGRVAKSATCGDSHSACHEVGFTGLLLNVRPFF